ncbi:TIGR04219 family outer membrane beta-barrel protein [Pleionea sediminis]|uniref:TIGR04219 family outer membrane beta-barrel protein n=1 Tax=Pleionea sediminis TaxID=2569479 RepID=UPI001185A7D7|nr:TIGR04219 family outer membrane beta-barrel protein [Pleionea sediminis]
MRKLIPAIVTASLLSTTASADVLGIYAGVGNWKPDFSGNIANNSDTSLNIGSDVDVDRDNQTGFYLAFEHPLPVIPNVMITQQDMASSGSGTFTGTFGNETFAGDINAEMDLSHQDYTLYYEILDNWVNLDLGLTARKFDGFAEVTDANDPATSDRESFDFTLPMLYGKARFDLPFTGLSVSAILNYISAGGNTVSDTSLILGYESSIGLGVEGGIRTFNLDVDDEDDFTTDLEFDGVFINLTYHF